MCANTPAVLANSNGKQEDRFVLKFSPEPQNQEIIRHAKFQHLDVTS